MTDIDIKKHKEYWLRNSQAKWEAAEVLYQGGKYVEALFFYHLAIESRLKAVVVVEIKEPVPLIHDLERLAEIAGLELDQQKRNLLREVTKFNMAGRYPDDKFEFYQKATREFTNEAIDKIKIIQIWLKNLQQVS